MGPWENTTHSLTPEQLRSPRCIGNSFVDAAEMATVAMCLRQAWLLQDNWIEEERFTPDLGDNKWFRELLDCIRESSEEKMIAMRNPDRENTATLVRKDVYFLWNHVFVDAAKSFAVICDTGRFFGPSYEASEVRFPTTDDEEGEWVEVDNFSYNTNIMLVPAFLEPGTKLLGMLENEKDQAQEANTGSGEVQPATFSFDATNCDWVYHGKIIWWIKANEKIHIFLRKRADMAGKLACVLVYGKYPE